MEKQEKRDIVRYIISEFHTVGKTKLQKTVYFAQEALGIPMDFEFTMHYYGPFSRELEMLTTEMNYLDSLDITYFSSGGRYGSEIKIREETDKIEIHRKYRDKIHGLLDVIRGYDASEMELCATIHFINSILEERGISNTRERVAKETQLLKPKFQMDQIYKYLDRLVDSKLLSTAG